ncbi:uncharacterized protein FTOL_03449 [Fusarium torulosum]|uniref:Uncharacterized protein n=1 Tax=Fusarium torulosum TaxID=33205 RepID=A0AAE8M3V5_9HYPO|nr:uncharacterized protein FTOL_03449 [Fusarium torulosum]
MAEPFIYVIDDDDELINPSVTPPINPPTNPPINTPINTPNNAPNSIAPPLTLEYVMGDQNVVDARPAHGRADSHEQLTSEEKLRLLTLFTYLETTRDPPFVLTTAHWHSFLNDIFGRWTTASNPPTTLSCLPESSWRLISGSASSSMTIPFPITSSRQASDCRKGSRDAKCEGISPDHVSLDQVMNSHTIRREAMINYDNFELPRIRKYNKALVTACARRAIKKWVEAGTGRYVHLDHSDTPADLKRPVSAIVIARDEGRRLIAAAAEAEENVADIEDEVI